MVEVNNEKALARTANLIYVICCVERPKERLSYVFSWSVNLDCRSIVLFW